jgi:hypothetical protein
MMKHLAAVFTVILVLLAVCELAVAAGSAVPEPFQRFDENSKYAINYDDLTALLKTVVVDMGRSTRRVSQPSADVTGTRMKTKIKMTANEGNRFYFETFKEEEEGQQYLRNIQSSLEQLPSDAPLEYFSRDEQLAYLLNQYNVTVLNEIIAVYPKKNLKNLFRGKNSIFSKKLLTVAGVHLSLNDIQFTILRENYDGNPLIMYGLYQGIIGGPNIRKSAYTGADVYSALKDNAHEFVNSNRGTYAKYEGKFRTSSLYDRNRVYFPDFAADLTQHLSTYLQGSLREKLESASKIKPNIDDWSVNDLGGTHRRVGGSFATSRAALLDSVKSTMESGSPMDGVVGMGASVGHGSSSTAAKGKHLSLIEPELLEILHELNTKRMAENDRKATVLIEDFAESPDESVPDTTSDKEENE